MLSTVLADMIADRHPAVTPGYTPAYPTEYIASACHEITRDMHPSIQIGVPQAMTVTQLVREAKGALETGYVAKAMARLMRAQMLAHGSRALVANGLAGAIDCQISLLEASH